MSVEEGRGYAYERGAAPDAPLALGAGLLALGLLGRPSRGEGSRARKTFSLLAILAALVILLWRALTVDDAAEEDAAEAAAEDADTESHQAEPAADAQAEALQSQVEEHGIEAEEVVEEVAGEAEETVEEAPGEVPATEEPAANTAEELAVVEESPEFEALDAALAALIGELERVEASRAEDARIAEARVEEARVEESEEQAALVHAGRQLVHAGHGEDGGPPVSGEGGGADYDSSEEAETDETDARLVEPELEPEFDLEPETQTEVETERVEPQAMEPVPVETVDAEVVPEPAEEAPSARGLVGLIGRYSHHGQARPLPASEAQVAASQPEPLEPDESVPEAASQSREADWL